MAQNGNKEAALADVFADFDRLHSEYLLYPYKLQLADLTVKYQTTFEEMQEVFFLWVNKRQHGE